MTQQTEAWTIGRIIEWTRAFFEKQRIDQPRLEAEILLAHVLGTERIDLYLNYEEPVDDQARARLRDLVRQRADHVPTRYLVGGCEFLSLAMRVTPDCLIPRPETELLVEEAVRLVPPDADASAVDLGTGSGCVAVALAVNRPRARLVATDVSPAALDVARTNAHGHGVADRITFLHGDLYDALDAADVPPADLLLANPPYVTEAEWDRLAPEIRDHEPRQALVAGPEGTEVIDRVVRGAPAYLKPGGTLLVEIGHGQAEAARGVAQAARGLGDVEIYRDYAGHPRILVARRT